MHSLMIKLREKLKFFTVIPVDHYTLLCITSHATSSEIEAAYLITILASSASPWRRFIGLMCGQSRVRINRARQELLDPVVRRRYDANLKLLQTIYQNHPH